MKVNWFFFWCWVGFFSALNIGLIMFKGRIVLHEDTHVLELNEGDTVVFGEAGEPTIVTRTHKVNEDKRTGGMLLDMQKTPYHFPEDDHQTSTVSTQPPVCSIDEYLTTHGYYVTPHMIEQMNDEQYKKYEQKLGNALSNALLDCQKRAIAWEAQIKAKSAAGKQ